MYQLRITPDPADVKTHVLTLPANAGLRSMLISPQGDRFAWLFEFQPPPSTSWLEDFFFPGDGKFALWVSNIDGSRMHEIGFIPVNAFSCSDKGSRFSAHPVDIDWLPDGKHLTLAEGSTYYKILAN